MIAILHKLCKLHLMVVHQNWIGYNNQGYPIQQGFKYRSCPSMANYKTCCCDLSCEIWEVVFYSAKANWGTLHLHRPHNMFWKRCIGQRGLDQSTRWAAR